MSEIMRHCTTHCASCGAHFRSTTAFDMHRRGEYAGRRYCSRPEHHERLAAVTECGVCEISGAAHEDGRPRVLAPVTVFGLELTPGQVAQLASLRSDVCALARS